MIPPSANSILSPPRPCRYERLVTVFSPTVSVALGNQPSGECRMEASEAGRAAGQREQGQRPDVPGDRLRIAALEHDVAQKAQIMSQWIDKRQPLNPYRHVLDGKHQAREHDSREHKEEAGH